MEGGLRGLRGGDDSGFSVVSPISTNTKTSANPRQCLISGTRVRFWEARAKRPEIGRYTAQRGSSSRVAFSPIDGISTWSTRPAASTQNSRTRGPFCIE